MTDEKNKRLMLSEKQIFDVLSYLNAHRQIVLGNVGEVKNLTTLIKRDGQKTMFTYLRSIGKNSTCCGVLSSAIQKKRTIFAYFQH